jgi:hypothetical protein
MIMGARIHDAVARPEGVSLLVQIDGEGGDLRMPAP